MQTVLTNIQKIIEVAPYVLEIVVALGLIIFVHELGHFMTAKWFNVRVRRFALGMGPIIVKWVRGETEYSLRWIPIGGFVDLVGEHPDAEEADDPRGLWRRPAWQKIIVFSAGVVMNAFLALVFFALAPIIGIQAIVPVAGGVVPGMPAEKAGILPGDRVVSINGRPIESFDDLLYSVALDNAGTTFDVHVERPGVGSEPPKALEMKIASVRPPESLFPVLGIEMERSNVVAGFGRPDAPLHQAGVEVDDRILAVNGKDVANWREIAKALADAPAGPVTLALERGGQTKELRVVPADLKTYEDGITLPTMIGAVEVGSPADGAGIKPGDRVVAMQGKPWPTVEEMSAAVKAAGNDAEIRLTLWRDKKTVDVACKTAMLPGADHPRLGISMAEAAGTPVQVGAVEPGGPAAEAGLKPGDIVTAAGDDGKKIDDWEALLRIIVAAEGKPVTLQVERDGTVLPPTTLRPKAVPQERLTPVFAGSMPLFAPLPRIYNPITAAQRGLRQTVLWLGRVYLNLKQFASGQVSTRAVGGPVAIAQWSINMAGKGMGTFMDFLGMLTVSIAVLNFLPLPPFDGGHVLFVLIDAIKRKPVSMRIRTIVWLAAWIGVLLLFVLITYRDIVRWITQKF
ncbi:MAG: RIP metalloprotease RseP [Planctomycetota bacterium]|nr:RIP metalloprotease RseP [Planctomycetota bacterium]